MTSKQAFFKWKRIHMWGYVRVFSTHFTHSHAEWTQLFFNFLVLLFLVNSSLHSFAIFITFCVQYFFRALPCSAPLCCILFLDIIHEGIFLRSPIFADFFFRCVFSSNFTFLPRFTFLVFFFKIYVRIHIRSYIIF